MKVELIDNMGNDNSVVDAARVSLSKQANQFTDEQNHKLINYLARGMTDSEYTEMINSVWGSTKDNVKSLFEQYRYTPSHFSPFCHTTITLRLKAPIAIHAQMMKHTVGFAHNTVSRRYVSETPELFMPKFREAPKGNVKQGSGDVIDVMYYACDGSSIEPTIEFMSSDKSEVEKYIETADKKLFLTNKSQDDLFTAYKAVCQEAVETYNDLVKLGVSPEQARFVLPQGVMTEWVSTGSLYAWARFYNLRTDAHAQKEIQDLAKMVGEIIEPLYPHSWKALTGVKQ